MIAHRGATAYGPENSLAALRAAAQVGADAVELDVRATADGALVVHHDAQVDGRALAEQPLTEVRDLRLSNGERIPTLEEALHAVDPRLDVFFELKALPPECDAPLLAELEHGPAPSRYRIHSFDHKIIRRLSGRRPDVPRGVLAAAYPVRPLVALRDANATALWQEYQLIDTELVDAVHEMGGTVYAWTVNDVTAMRRLAALGIDGLCTDVPELAIRMIGP